jgi:hypothetical protein
MKKSEFKAQIKEEIIDILEAASAEDVQAQKDFNDELEKTAQLKKDAGIEEGNDSDKFQDDGYVNHTYKDSTIDKYNIPVEPTAVFEDDEDEPKASQLKGDSISILATKLQQVTKEMKQIVKKWKEAEGSEKDKLTDELRTKTKIKKELESLLENKK